MRLGLIVPSTNTVAERDFQRCVKDDVSVHTARMFIEATTADGERQMLEEYLASTARDIGSIQPDVVVFSCTSAAAVIGPAAEEALVRDLTQATRAPVVSTNAAVHKSLSAVRASRVAVVTPYVEELTARISEGIERQQMVVPVAAGMGIVDPFDIAEIEPAEILDFAERELHGQEFDTIFVSCTNLRGLEARPALQERFGVPIVTSNQAAIDAALASLRDPSCDH